MKFRSLALLSLAAVAGCHPHGKAKVKDAGSTTAGVDGRTGTGTETSVPKVGSDDVRNGLPDLKPSVTLGTIYFALDAAALDGSAKSVLDHDATVLRDNPEVTIRIEGHADERGSTQYNLGLGERRASAVRTYLQALGVSTARMEVVSYGEEKPAAAGGDEASWAKNRRAELAVTAGSDKVSSSYGMMNR